VVIALGIILALVVLIASLTNDSNEIKVGGSIFAGIIVLVCLGIAEAYFLAAESIGVFLAIEMNTRGTPATTVTSEEISEKVTSEEEVVQQGGVKEEDREGKIYVKEPEYVSLENEEGTAFCLGCRQIAPKKELYYNEETDTYYHKACLPKN